MIKKTLKENLQARFGVFRRYKKATPGCNGLNKSRNPESLKKIIIIITVGKFLY